MSETPPPVAPVEAPNGPEIVRAEPLGAMPSRRELVLAGRVALAELGVDPDDLVDERTEAQLRRAMPENTVELLRWAYGFLIKYCGKTGRRHDPPTVGTIRKMICDSFYLTDKRGRGAGRYGRPYAPATIETAVYCLSMIFDRLQWVNPCRHPLVADQLKGYREDYEAAGHRSDESDALTPQESVALARSQDVATVQGLRNAAMMRGQFDLGCRADEWCKVLGGDVVWLDEHRVQITFVRTKGRKTRTVPMQATPDVDADVDPVLLLGRYVKARIAAGWDGEGPLWVEVQPGPRRADFEQTGTLAGRFLTKQLGYQAYARVFNRAVIRTGIGVDPVTKKRNRHLTTHSNRSGMITEAFRQGMRLEEIAPRTGHSPASPVMAGYLRLAPAWDTANPGVLIRRAHGAATPTGDQEGREGGP